MPIFFVMFILQFNQKDYDYSEQIIQTYFFIITLRLEYIYNH